MKDAGIRFDSGLHIAVQYDPDRGSCEVVVTMNREGTEVVQTGSVVWDD